MGLLREKCVDCGETCSGLFSFTLDEGKCVCKNCYNKISVPARAWIETVADPTVLWTLENYQAYMEHRKKAEIKWNQLCSSDAQLKKKIRKLMDNLYICDEYKFYIVGELPDNLSYTTEFDVYTQDEVEEPSLMYKSTSRKENKGNVLLVMILKDSFGVISYLLKEKVSAEEGRIIGETFDAVYGYKLEWVQEAEFCNAEIGRMKIMSRMEAEKQKQAEETFDLTNEKSLGLFMLDEKQTYDISYLDHVRNSLIQVYGMKPEIEQAYEYLLNRIGNMPTFRVCPKCGQQNPHSARFCENCGMILG